MELLWCSTLSIKGLEEIAHTSKQCTKKRAESSDNDSSIPYFVVIAQKKATEKSAERAKQKAAKKKTKAIKRAEQESKAVALARKLNVNEARLEGNGRRNIAFFANRDVENSSDEDSIDDSEVDCSNVAVIQGGTEEQEWPSEDEEDDTEEQEANFGVSFASKLSVQPSPLSVSSVPTNAPPVFGLDDGADDLDVEPSNLHTVSHDNAKLGENAKKESTKKMKNNKKKSKRNGGDFPVEEEEQAQAEDPKEVARRARDAKLSAKAESKKKYAAFEARMFPKLAESHPLAKRRQVSDIAIFTFDPTS